MSNTVGWVDMGVQRLKLCLKCFFSAVNKISVLGLAIPNTVNLQ